MKNSYDWIYFFQAAKMEKGSHFQMLDYFSNTEDSKGIIDKEEKDANDFLQKLRQYKQLDWKINGLVGEEKKKDDKINDTQKINCDMEQSEVTT